MRYIRQEFLAPFIRMHSGFHISLQFKVSRLKAAYIILKTVSQQIDIFSQAGHLVIVMADVSGKGIPAALFMVNAKTSIKNRTLNGGKLSPSQVLYDVNNQLCEGNDAELFVTVWLGILEISPGKVVYLHRWCH